MERSIIVTIKEYPMLKKEYTACPVCDSDKYNVLFEPWQDIQDPTRLYGAASGVRGAQRLVECQVCAMIYENPRFPENVILEGYVHSEEASHDSQHSMRVESFSRALKSLHDCIPTKDARVLDIGTAGGAFLDAAKRFGYKAVGLEPSYYLVKQGKSRGLNIEQGTIDNHPFEPASFDMICLWDVLEHLPDPKGSLLKIKPLLRQNGVLLINYPDIGTWQAKLAGRFYWWILSVHLHHFSRDTIKKVCDRTGYKVFHFQRYWQTLQIGYLEEMAIHYKIPLSKLLKHMTPRILQRLPLPYYASQTTALARVNP